MSRSLGRKPKKWPAWQLRHEHPSVHEFDKSSHTPAVRNGSISEDQQAMSCRGLGTLIKDMGRYRRYRSQESRLGSWSQSWKGISMGR